MALPILRLRPMISMLLVGAIIAAIWLSWGTQTGQQLMRQPRAFGADVQAWVVEHPLLAPLIFLAAYQLCAMLILPIWWLQILAGFGFGLTWGCTYAALAAAITATVTTLFSRWLAGEWFKRRIETNRQRIQRLEEALGHNGLLVVMAVRLLYFLPFGISNYLFGLTRINAAEVFWGSLLGGLPALALYVTAGADPLLWKDWRYWIIFIPVNLLLLAPLFIRYRYPQWFKRIGMQ